MFDVAWDLIFSFDNPLDCYATILSERPAAILKMFKIDWDIKKFCDSSLRK